MKPTRSAGGCRWRTPADTDLERWLLAAENLDDDRGPVPEEALADWLRTGDNQLSELAALALLDELIAWKLKAEKGSK